MSAQPRAISPSAYDLKQRIMRRLQAMRSLPTSVGVAIRLFGLQRGDAANPAEYARVIASDAGLSARIIAVANSPWFGLAMRISQPLVAVNLLGVPAVRTLAVNFCLSGLHHEMRLSKEESQRFWEASLCKAVAARQLALHLNPKVADDAYIAGLFQDMAVPVIYASSRELMGPLLESRMNVRWRLAGECEVFGATHAEFGQTLAQRLELPEAHVRLIGAHHDLEALTAATGPEACALAYCAYAASLFPHRMDYWDAADVETLRVFLAQQTGGKLELTAFLDEVGAECKTQFSYFDRSQVTEVRLLELLAEATREAAEEAVRLVGAVREMESYVASADQAVVRMAQEKTRLAEEASRDALTGALNRAGFQKECVQAFARAQHDRHPVALLFMDIDEFKQVNDAYGHAAGDTALKQLVAVLRECTRATDLVGRLGGDEFAVFLPNCPQAKAVEIAERIRKQVSVRKLDGGCSISVSIGVTCAADAVRSLEALLAASDRRMYVAKRAGGNTVSIESADAALTAPPP